MPPIRHASPMLVLPMDIATFTELKKRRVRQPPASTALDRCPSCQTLFSSVSAVTRHRDSAACPYYTPPEVIEYKCTHEGCQQSFIGRKFSFQRHQKNMKHTGTRATCYILEQAEPDEISQALQRSSPISGSAPAPLQETLSAEGTSASSLGNQDYMSSQYPDPASGSGSGSSHHEPQGYDLSMNGPNYSPEDLEAAEILASLFLHS